MSEEYTAWRLQIQADHRGADLASQDPQPTGSDLAWQQEEIRTAYTAAAHMTAQPEK